MSRSIIIAIAACVPALPVSAQTTFERYYGGIVSDYANEVLETPQGDFLLVGYTASFGNGKLDVYLIKVNSQGDTVWTKSYGTASYEWGMSIKPTDDGGYLIGGFHRNANGDNMYILKVNGMGDSLWSKSYGDPEVKEPFRMIRLSDGNYAIVGYTWSSGNGQADVYLLKINPNGDTVWTRTYGGPLQDWGFDVAETSDKGFIVAGMTNSYGNGDFDMYILRLDSAGDTLWSRTIGGWSYEQARSVVVTKDDGFIIVGYTESSGAGDIYILKLSPAGDTLWSKLYGGSFLDAGMSARLMSDSGLVIAGLYSKNDGDEDAFLMRTDIMGDTLWVRKYGGLYNDRIYHLINSSDGGFVMTGTTESFGAGYHDVYLLKTDSLGNIITGLRNVTRKMNPVAIYPNPFSSQATLFFPNPGNKEAEFRIIDIAGRLISQRDGLYGNQVRIERGDLAPGLYLYELRLLDGVTHSGKLFIE